MRFPTLAVVLALGGGTGTCAFVENSNTSRRGRAWGSMTSSSRLQGLPEPLASEGAWTAFLDEETTGLIYYFNSKTGESVWEAPSRTFPEIKLTSKKKKIMDAKRREYQASQGLAYEEEETNGSGGFFGSLFGASKKEPGVVVDDSPAVEEPYVEEISNPLKATGTKKKGFLSGILKQAPTSSGQASTTKEQQPAEENLTAEPAKETESVKKSPIFSFGSQFGGAKVFNGSSSGSDVVAEELVVEEAMSVEDDDLPDEMVEKALQIERSFVFPDVLSVFKTKTREPDIIVPSERIIAIETASSVLPSPEKASWGGEDACFVKGRTFGVFDGVSGADKLDGVPLYSETLSKQLIRAVPESGLTIEELTTLLTDAAEFADVAATGASTALVGSIGEDGYLRALNLGDCAVIVLREGQVVAKSKEITHYFDCPYQLGEDSPDRPIDGTILKTEVFPGDIIVAGSDGIFDNIRENDIWDLVSSSQPKASVIAKKIIDESRSVSLDKTAPTPYAVQAKKNKYDDYKSGLGGKVDDISCVVLRCT